MRMGKLVRAFFQTLAALSVLGVFVVLDWYPTVKELGWLRRECSDLERKTKDYGAMASGFVFPGEKEQAYFALGEDMLLRLLPRVAADAAWLGLAHADLLNRAKGIAILMVPNAAEAFGPGPPGFADWLKLQERNIHLTFQAADPLRVYPWRGMFLQDSVDGEQLASRLLGVALEASMPKLLDFVNHISWGKARLEIVRLRMEPAGQFVRAWLVCRGSYKTRKPSPWAVKVEPEEGGEDLLVDPDSPLLLRKVDPRLAPWPERKELPPPGSPW